MVRAVLDVILHPDRDRSVRRRHPWVLSGAVRELRGGDPQSGGWARVISAAGQVLAYGHYAPDSAIRVRLLVFGESADGADEGNLIAKRIARAVARRTGDVLLEGTDAVRLPNQLLEMMADQVESGATGLVFVVSGEVTEYGGERYLLTRSAIGRPIMGNLSK